MKIIGITRPDFFEGEADAITQLIEGGLDLLHLRKPGSLSEDFASLLLDIPAHLYSQIVIHDHFELTECFPLKGIHLNSRHPEPPAGYSGSVSLSCHTIEELKGNGSADYCFLSPVFDSISKPGYNSGFSAGELEEASRKGVINEKVIALGGIEPHHIPLLENYGFGGVALLGYLWKNATTSLLNTRLQKLLNLIR